MKLHSRYSRLFVALLVCIALPLPAVAAASFNTVADMMRAKGLSGAVTTKAHEYAGDGAGMTFNINATRPNTLSGKMASPLADGRWAVPTGMATRPKTIADASSVSNALTRARTFAAAGRDLQWNSTNSNPLGGGNKIIHKVYTKPYAITCSAFVGMVLMGWDYQHTTYVADTNTRVGDYVNFGRTAGKDLWQAHKLARWFYAHDAAWVYSGMQDLRPGDLLFFSDADPSAKYFLNVSHVGMYVGNDKIIHSWGAEAPAGVVEEPLSAYRGSLTVVARPTWVKHTAVANG